MSGISEYPTAGNKISTTDFNSRDAATLAASATFQGVGEDVSKYGRVGVSIKSDNATDGVLTMETSHDNVTWGGPTRTWADTSIAAPHMWNIVEKYFRIKYVNGTTEATNLSIQVQYSNNADIVLAHQLNESLAPEVEAQIVRLGSDFDLDVLRGNIGGTVSAPIVAHSDTVGTNLRHLYSETNTADTDHLALFDTPSTVKVASTSANDTSAGTGAQTVAIVGVDTNGVEAVEIEALNGQTEVTTTTVFKAVHSVIVVTAGSGQKNAGILWVGNGSFTSGVPATKYMAAEANTGSSRGFMYLVPTGKTLYMKDLTAITSDTNKDLNLQLNTYTGSVLYEALDLHLTGANVLPLPLSSYPGITGGTLMYLNANVDTGTANIQVIVNAKLVTT